LFKPSLVPIMDCRVGRVMGDGFIFTPAEAGPFQLWKVPAQGGTPVRVTKSGGMNAMECEDGRFVYYRKIKQSGIWRAPLQGGDEQSGFEPGCGRMDTLSERHLFL